ncbi:MAG: hypothetical protein QG566_148 [Patescibacteria group bacterium]|jgi:hypothetical protein|nr:hypothetical protein [Patescibacteria group bacterium]
MQFKVPQFIDVEDKLFGPFTFKQFAYLAGGGGMAFSAYKLLPIYFAIPIIIVVVGLALLLTFYKINGQNFIYYLQASIVYAAKSKLYIWKQKLHKKEEKKVEAVQAQVIPTLTDSKLKDLAWSLDILDNKNNNNR